MIYNYNEEYLYIIKSVEATKELVIYITDFFNVDKYIENILK